MSLPYGGDFFVFSNTYKQNILLYFPYYEKITI